MVRILPKNPKKIVCILTILAGYFAFGQMARAQTQAETEPNGTVSQAGTQFIDTQITITGTVCLGGGCPSSDPTDFWNIANGSGGTFIATWSDNVIVTLFNYGTSPTRSGPPSSVTLTSGVSQSLSSSNFYSISAQFVTLSTLTSYSIALSGTALPPLSSNTPPTASGFTSTIFEDVTYVFSTSEFSYSDVDGDPLDNLLIEVITAAGTLYLDADNDDTFDPGEQLSSGNTVSRADLDAGNLQYIQNGSTNTSFQFEVNDGTENSTGNYVANLNVSPIPTVTLSIDRTADPENVTSNNPVTANLSNAYGLPTVINLAFSGTATLTADYTRTGTTITIPAGNTSGNITIANVNDAIDEANETVIIDISSVTNGVEGTPNQVVYTINDDDPAPTVTLGLSGSPLAENGGVATVTATLSEVSGRNVTVNLGFTGTAINGGIDYTASGTSIVIAAGNLSNTITLTGNDDALDEDDETVMVDITGVTNGTESGTQQVTATITDDDPTPTVTLGLSGSPFAENGGVATVTATLSAASGRTVAVILGLTGTATGGGTDYTASGTAIVIAPGDLSHTITLTGNNDALDEDDETVIVDIITVTNGTESGIQQVTATITDDDAAPTVTLGLSGSPLAENGGVATVTATLSAVSSRDVTVNLGLTGTAIGGGTDYTASGTSIVITAGNLSNTITLTGNDDVLDEDDETVIVDITGVTNGTESGTQQVTATITDDDPAPTVTLALSGSPLTENGGSATVTATLSIVSSRDVTVNLGLTGTATGGGIDYSASGTSIVITAGNLSNTITLAGNDDALDEDDETVIVDITGVTNGTESGTQQVTATITDDDPAPTVTLGLGGSPFAENGGVATVTATLSAVSARDVTVNLGLTGTATGGGVDYTASGTSIAITAGNLTNSITLTGNDDASGEGDETVIVDITGVTNGVELGAQQVTAVVADDDVAILSIVATTQAAEDATNGVFTVSTSNPFSTNTQVTFTVGGTATPGVDFTALGTSFEFLANTNSFTITVPVIADDLDESDETVMVTLTGTNNPIVTIGTPNSAQITLVDNDESPVVTPGQAFSVNEDVSNTFSLGVLTATDTDAGTSFSNWRIESGNSDGIFDVDNSTGELTIVDNTNLDRESTASYTLSVTVTDGTNRSVAENVTINVNDVNDELPLVIPLQEFTITEGIPNSASVGMIQATDADVTATTFQSWTIVNGNSSTDGDADLPFALDPSTGELSVNDTDDINSSQLAFLLEVTVSDGVNTSASTVVTVNVRAINDAPSFTSGTDINVNEDAAGQTVTGWATDIQAGPPDESSQTLTFNLLNDNTALFDQQPALSEDGTLSFAPAADQFGTANITVSLMDNGGTDNGGVDTSADQAFTITIAPVNDAPQFTKGPDQNVSSGANLYTVPNWATDISAGPVNESAQVLSFIVDNDNNGLFSTSPAIAVDGTLTYAVLAGVSGSATVSVILSDDGGTVNGGADASATQEFIINVGRLPQVISFATLEDKRVGSDPVLLEATGGNSGLPVTFSIATEPTNGVASLVGNSIIVEGIGRVEVTASQAGNNEYEPAQDVVQAFNILANDLFLPTLFSPNEDNVNDRFILRGGGNVSDIEFSVFDRNGNQVFNSSSWAQLSQEGWDGKSDGEDQPQGAYIWVIRGTFGDGRPLLVNGNDNGIIRLAR